MSSQQHDAFVAEEFDRAAARYDHSRLVQSYQHRVQALVVDSLNIKRGMHVLDLGCRTGWATLEIALRLEGTGKVVGLDLSEGMIEQARQKLPRLRYGNVEFVQESASSLNYDACFDYVVSTNAFHHLANREQVFAKVWRSLKRGGTLVIQDFCRDFFLMRFVDLMGKIGERAHVGMMIPADSRLHYWNSIRSCYTPEELQAVLERSQLTGWNIVEDFMDLMVVKGGRA